MNGYLRVKKWKDWQHYKDREPPWVKLHRKLLSDSDFMALDESEQWQLVRIWMICSSSSLFTLDDQLRKVPVVLDDEKVLRRAIGTLKKIPLAKFVCEGWLIVVQPDDLIDEKDTLNASAVLAPGYPDASTLLGLELKRLTTPEKTQDFPPLALARPQGLNRGVDKSPLGKLRAACGVDEGSDDEGKLRRAMRGVCEADIVDVAQGARRPNLHSRLGWTLSELKRRKAVA